MSEWYVLLKYVILKTNLISKTLILNLNKLAYDEVKMYKCDHLLLLFSSKFYCQNMSFFLRLKQKIEEILNCFQDECSDIYLLKFSHK